MSLKELADRIAVYGGGSGVVVSSQTLQAQVPETYSVTLMQFPLPVLGITVADVCTIIGVTCVVIKLCMDYLTWKRNR